MKRAHQVAKQSSSKQAYFKPEPELPEILPKVYQGYYQAFHAYLQQHALTELNLAQKLSGLSTEELQYLGQAFNNTAITQLNVSNNQLTGQQMLALIQGLHQSSVTQLNFSGNDICGTKHQGSWTRSADPIFTLENISDPVLQAKLKQALLASQIVTLDCSNNGLSATGACALIKAIQQTQVDHLYLGNNRIANSHLDQVALALNHSAITTLNLNLSGINNHGFKALLLNLDPKQITSLDLSLNPQINDKINQLLTFTLANSSINTLKVNHTGLSDSLKNELAQIIANRAPFNTMVQIPSPLDEFNPLTQQLLQFSQYQQMAKVNHTDSSDSLKNELAQVTANRALLPTLDKNNYQAFTRYLIDNQISTLNLSQLLQKNNPVQLHYLGKALQGTSVAHLDVSNNYLTDDEMLSLIKSLSNTQVSEINFSLNDIADVITSSHDAVSNHFSKAWINCLNSALLKTKIEKLDFSCNDLSTAGASSLLAATLATQVTNINFAGNCIGKQHMDLLAQNLIHSPVTNLNLSLNEICYTGLVKLSTKLPSSSLTILNLSLNPELAHDAAVLLKAILPHTQLIDLNLDNTNISTIEQKELAALIERQRIKLIEEIHTSIQQDLTTNHYSSSSYLPLQDITNQSNHNSTSYNIAEKNSSKVSSKFNFK